MKSISQKQAPADKEASPSRQKGALGRRPSTATPGREVLLSAAMVHFAKFGYEGTSLRAVATNAGVDMALVARLFGSKAQLWIAVVDHLAEHQTEHLAQLRVTASLASMDPRLALRKLIELFAQISYEMPAFPAFLMHESSNPGERMLILVERLVAPFRLACTPVIVAAMASGIVRVKNLELFFSMLITAIAVPMASPILITRDGKLTPGLRDEIAREACNMVLA